MAAPISLGKAPPFNTKHTDACHSFIVNVAESSEGLWILAMPFLFVGSGSTGSGFSRKGVDHILKFAFDLV